MQRVYCICGRGLKVAGEESCTICNDDQNSRYEGKVYRMMPCNTKLKKYWLRLEGQELFTYRRDDDPDPKQSLFLKNISIREE